MANKIYIAEETALDWTETGGTYTLDCGGLAAAAVRVGARGDLGSGSRSEWYTWRVVVDGFDAAPVVGETVDVYLSTSDGTNEDANVGTSDAGGVVAQLPNLLYLGSATVQTTTAADQLIASGIVRITARYVSPVIHNKTAVAMYGGATTADNHHFYLTPVPPEVQ